MKKRYLTLEMVDDLAIKVMAEHETTQEERQDAIDGAHCWVWQWASSAEQAAKQHIKKHRQWERDNVSGAEIKETY